MLLMAPRFISSYIQQFAPSASAAQYISLIQDVDIYLASAALSGTAAITSVNTSLAICLFRGFTTNAKGTEANMHLYCPRVDLTNSTTVTAVKNATTGTSTTTSAKATIIQFTSQLVSNIRTGVLTIGAGATSAATSIATVDLSRSIVIPNGTTPNSTAGGGTPSACFAILSLPTANAVGAKRSSTAGTVDCGFTVIEWVSGVAPLIQSFAIPLSAVLSANATITSADPNNTIIFPGGMCPSGFDSTPRLQQVSATTIAAIKPVAAGNTLCAGSVVTFVPGILSQNTQYSTNTYASGNTLQNYSITSANLNKSFVVNLEISTSTASQNDGSLWGAPTLTSSDNVRWNTFIKASSSRSVSHQVVSFVN